MADCGIMVRIPARPSPWHHYEVSQVTVLEAPRPDSDVIVESVPRTLARTLVTGLLMASAPIVVASATQTSSRVAMPNWESAGRTLARISDATWSQLTIVVPLILGASIALIAAGRVGIHAMSTSSDRGAGGLRRTPLDVRLPAAALGAVGALCGTYLAALTIVVVVSAALSWFRLIPAQGSHQWPDVLVILPVMLVSILACVQLARVISVADVWAAEKQEALDAWMARRAAIPDPLPKGTPLLRVLRISLLLVISVLPAIALSSIALAGNWMTNPMESWTLVWYLGAGTLVAACLLLLAVGQYRAFRLSASFFVWITSFGFTVAVEGAVVWVLWQRAGTAWILFLLWCLGSVAGLLSCFRWRRLTRRFLRPPISTAADAIGAQTLDRWIKKAADQLDHLDPDGRVENAAEVAG